jgi:hypothetical protein
MRVLIQAWGNVEYDEKRLLLKGDEGRQLQMSEDNEANFED